MKAQVFASGALLAVVLAAGCAAAKPHARSGPDPLAMEEAAAPDAAPVLHVNNRHWQDVDVWAIRNTTRMRLGTVSSMMHGDFKLPPTFSVGEGDFELLVAPVGESRGFTTPPILLAAGQTLDLQVESSLNLSTFSVY